MAGNDKGSRRNYEYELGHTDRELNRLATQARLVDPMTRQFFKDAGVVGGMRVLDIGSGAGDVAFLAADLVGPSGEVVGTDRSPIAIAAAQARAKARSLNNVSFLEGDPTVLAFNRSFDAIVGRYVLMFSPDPTTMLRGIAQHLRPGGVIAFHEVDWTGVRSFPPSPIYDQSCAWILETFKRVGTNAHMGLDLYSTFVKAGLPAPTMGLHALIGGGSNNMSGLDLIADLAVTMAPVMEQMGVATVADVAPITLNGRMHAEVEALGSIVIGRHEIGAWSRLP
jgi:ubiquinone/menaquinone biosynthesis C-methylase UbiE